MNVLHDEGGDSQDQHSTQNMGLEVRKTANEAIISKLYVNILLIRSYLIKLDVLLIIFLLTLLLILHTLHNTP